MGFAHMRRGVMPRLFDYCVIDNSKYKNITILINAASPYLNRNKRLTI